MKLFPLPMSCTVPPARQPPHGSTEIPYPSSVGPLTTTVPYRRSCRARSTAAPAARSVAGSTKRLAHSVPKRPSLQKSTAAGRNSAAVAPGTATSTSDPQKYSERVYAGSSVSGEVPAWNSHAEATPRWSLSNTSQSGKRRQNSAFIRSLPG